jgi:hypothetical protein
VDCADCVDCVDCVTSRRLFYNRRPVWSRQFVRPPLVVHRRIAGGPCAATGETMSAIAPAASAAPEFVTRHPPLRAFPSLPGASSDAAACGGTRTRPWRRKAHTRPLSAIALDAIVGQNDAEGDRDRSR